MRKRLRKKLRLGEFNPRQSRLLFFPETNVGTLMTGGSYSMKLNGDGTAIHTFTLPTGTQVLGKLASS